MNTKRLSILALVTAGLIFYVPQVGAQAAPPKYAPNVPAKITTPDTVETRIGTLHFKDGTPDAETVQLAYDQLDFGRGIDAFLKGMSATSVYAGCRGFEEAGIKLNQGIGISENLLDARSLFLTANTTTVYAMFCVDLKDGPMVVRVPCHSRPVRFGVRTGSRTHGKSGSCERRKRFESCKIAIVYI